MLHEFKIKTYDHADTPHNHLGVHDINFSGRGNNEDMIYYDYKNEENIEKFNIVSREKEENIDYGQFNNKVFLI